MMAGASRASPVRILVSPADRSLAQKASVVPAPVIGRTESEASPALAPDPSSNRVVVTDASSPAVRGIALRLKGALGDDDFFARAALDVGPYPMRTVLIDYPPLPEGGGTYVSELSLFIDELGSVVRIRVDGQALPAVMEEAARQAFMGTVFSPGQVDGLPVRSRIRVEVIFEEGAPGR